MYSRHGRATGSQHPEYCVCIAREPRTESSCREVHSSTPGAEESSCLRHHPSRTISHTAYPGGECQRHPQSISHTDTLSKWVLINPSKVCALGAPAATMPPRCGCVFFRLSYYITYVIRNIMDDAILLVVVLTGIFVTIYYLDQCRNSK